MKATGIVRRIDDLGRVVIPKGDQKNATDKKRGHHWRFLLTGRGRLF